MKVLTVVVILMLFPVYAGAEIIAGAGLAAVRGSDELNSKVSIQTLGYKHNNFTVSGSYMDFGQHNNWDWGADNQGLFVDNISYTLDARYRFTNGRYYVEPLLGALYYDQIRTVVTNVEIEPNKWMSFYEYTDVSDTTVHYGLSLGIDVDLANMIIAWNRVDLGKEADLYSVQMLFQF